MDDAELVGGVLYDTAEPMRAAASLAQLLMAGVRDSRRVRELGFEPALVEPLSRALPRDPHSIELACAKGAAWVLGRRSALRHDSWELVASLPSAVSLPNGLRRTTGETLILVTSEAERRLRFAAPFVDPVGVGFLAEAIAAATLRGVIVEVFEPIGSESAIEAIRHLEAMVGSPGDAGRLRRVRTRQDAPWPHMKVMVADSIVAYIGSANITVAGLAGRNLELGVLIRGRQVVVIDRILDLCRSTENSGAGTRSPSRRP